MSSNAFLARPGVVLLLAVTTVGFGLALYAYFAPLTGVTATLGALAAILTSAVLVLFALLLATLHPGGMRRFVFVLTVIGLGGNAFAGALLHEWWLCGAMLTGLVGLGADALGAGGHNAQVHS